MRRSPNLTISQWFRQNALWGAVWGARPSCPDRLDLPWISDVSPTIEQRAEMSAICAQCPAMRQCARYAMKTNGGRGVDGGFYAGVWLPWPSSTESGEVKLARSRARRQLKRILKPAEVVNA